MKQALIVVDVQESFRKRPYWRGEDFPVFLKNVQSLIDLARARNIPVVQVFHEELTDDSSHPFSRGSGMVRTMPELRPDPRSLTARRHRSAMRGMPSPLRFQAPLSSIPSTRSISAWPAGNKVS